MSIDVAAAIFRHLTAADYEDALALYRELAGDVGVAEGDLGQERFNAILTHPGTSIWGAEVDGKVLSVATLHILPNMTYGGRPYCLVENVVTSQTARNAGLARGVMSAAIAEAWAVDAYKIMLLTGKSARAKGFYEKLGFSDDEKYGMVMRHGPRRKPRDPAPLEKSR